VWREGDVLMKTTKITESTVCKAKLMRARLTYGHSVGGVVIGGGGCVSWVGSAAHLFGAQ